MNQILRIAATVGVLAITSPAWAQSPLPAPSPFVVPPAYPAQPRYRYTTPGDDYRAGLINRWELERIEGPLPPALQGPNPSGNRGQNVN